MFQLKVSDSMISGQPAELPQKHHVKEQAEEICPGGMGEKGRRERQTVKHEKRDWGVGKKEQEVAYFMAAKEERGGKEGWEKERKTEKSYLPNGSYEEGRLEERQRKEEKR